MQKLVKLMIVDDHAIFRQSFTHTLRNFGFRIIYEASDGKEALELLKEISPDVIVLDIEMPVMNGVEALKLIKRNYPGIKVVILTANYYQVYIKEAKQLGADAFLPKNCDIQELIKIIRTMMPSDILPKSQSDKGKFSEREVEIIRLISREFTNKQIADMLSLSIRTVDGHKERILKKMQAKNSIGIVMYAMKHGLID